MKNFRTVLAVVFAFALAGCAPDDSVESCTLEAKATHLQCPVDTGVVGGDYYFPAEVDGVTYFHACEKGTVHGPICQCPTGALVVMDLYVPEAGAHYVDDGDAFCEVDVEDGLVYCYM